MLLLQRHQNESIVIHKEGEPEEPLVLRVTEVLPTGDVTLGFIGSNYNIVRQEIFGKQPKPRRTQHKEMNDENEYKRNYYS
jgi:sRNA-binding carbon storage regulator CsrA